MLQISLIILVAYVLLILSFYIGFNKVPECSLSDAPPKHRFSVLIPFRNEVTRLPVLLSSIAELNYPCSHFEILFINDGSTDNSVALIEDILKAKCPELNYRVLHNIVKSNAPKKDAIRLGVSAAKHPFIVTTDADVQLPKYWLDSFNEFIDTCDPYLVVGPVRLSGNSRFIERFQVLDFYSLQGSTIGSFGMGRPFMCNGANLCYSKSVFDELRPYKTNDQVASGDDVFLLEAFLKHHKTKVHYLKCPFSVVETEAVHSWSALVAQRQRWASKSKKYSLFFGKLVAALVLLMNLWLALAPLFIIFGKMTLKQVVLILIVKALTDFLLLFKTLRFFDAVDSLVSFISSSLFYPFFVCYIGLISIFKIYQWKGRHFKT
jgi:biofilm PGA synthesis N-glycosyltransferase PgaC